MSIFIYYIEKRKFDERWDKKEKYYLDKGMEPESVEDIRKYDWGWFNLFGSNSPPLCGEKTC